MPEEQERPYLCPCGCRRFLPFYSRSRYYEPACRARHWRQKQKRELVAARESLSEHLAALGDREFRDAVRMACEERWEGRGRFRVRYGRS